MSLIKMMLVMVSVAAISKTFGLLRFLLRLSFLAKLRLLPHLLTLWVCKLLMLMCILTKNVITFFFQAEDGIRDYKVTGVQTCALPILARARPDCRVSADPPCRTSGASRSRARRARPQRADRKSVVEGKSVDLGGRRIIH